MRENRVMRLLKEYWTYNREFTVRLGWIFPFLIIWRTFFPELYFGNRLTVLAEFSIFILMPVAFFSTIYDFWKDKKK
jgi:hypothetical protein